MMQQRLCLIIIGSVLVASIQHATAARKGPGPTNDAYYGACPKRQYEALNWDVLS